jgi:UDP-N-acetylmuramoyl-L-alanyl-D-glutamate--2,6-diaminopimelate ligase
MKSLTDILYGISIIEVHGRRDISVNEIYFDSRKVTKNSLFVAVRGTQSDGHDFIETAIEKGAVVIIAEKFPAKFFENIIYIKVKESDRALAQAAHNFYDQPSLELKLIAVTGTNGKTTIVTLLFQLFRLLGHKCGLLSTIENKIEEKILPATHTTPDPVQINKLLAQMVKDGCTHAFMEASSHAIDQNRIGGLQFAGAVFTNLTREHIDYHKTVENYLTAKKKLFDELSAEAFALVNADDKNGKVMVQNTKATVQTYSIQSPADFTARILENTFDGLVLKIDGQEIMTQLVGQFNASNLLAIYATAVLLKEDKIKALTKLSLLRSAEGRFDTIISPNEKIAGIVDYAHTPDALEKVLGTLKSIRSGNETLITVVGCGGDRDAGKRPQMAHIAYEMSDKLVLTSDNPRSEDPNAIIDEMKKGLLGYKTAKVLSIADRREAIKTAVSLARAHDIILVAGKGHEKYQEIKGVKYPFDDKEILLETFKMMNK